MTRSSVRIAALGEPVDELPTERAVRLKEQAGEIWFPHGAMMSVGAVLVHSIDGGLLYPRKL